MLNAHARIEIALAIVLLLGSCGGPSLSDEQKEEVADIAGDAAPDTSALESRIDDLESALEEVKNDADKVDDLDGRLSSVESRIEDVANQVNM